ncbi:MAG: glycosyltransferase family 2 protein [Candidatus Magasanikbacteria bacterium]|nr:glycosyltransferase family 2 protein [Candidatus Magasanikbacteria bacterium]
MIFVIVPAFNEEQSIGRVVAGLSEHGFEHIIVVDDGSHDKTSQCAQEAGAVVLRHVVNRGQGASLQTGNEYALKHGAATVVHFDADGQFNPSDIKPAIEFLQAHKADVLLGSRFLDDRSKIPWTKKNLVLPIGRFINRFLTGLTLSDAHNGFRILSKTALEKINISQDRMAHNSDIVKQIKEHGLLFVEYPVEVKYFEYGQGVGGGFKILQDILTAKFLK